MLQSIGRCKYCTPTTLPTTNNPSTNTSRYENHFGCNKCKRILPRDAFGNRQINKRRKGRPGSLKRFCIDCGFRRRIYRRGQPVAGNGFSLYVCSMCSEVHGTGLYCYFCGTPHRCFEKGFKAAIDAVVEADPGANDGLGVEPGVKKRKKLSRLERSCPRCYLRHAYPRINERSKHYAHFMELLDRRR